MLVNEQRFLHQRLVSHTNHSITSIAQTTQTIKQWIDNATAKANKQFTIIRRHSYLQLINHYYPHVQDYIESVPYVNKC